jgi:ankyrin repeat protein
MEGVMDLSIVAKYPTRSNPFLIKITQSRRTPTLLLTAITVLVLAAWVGIAGAVEDQDEQLIEAAEAGDTARVKTILSAGVDVDASIDKGRTALMRASLMGRSETVQALLEAGACVNAKDRDGYTALHSAVRGGSRAVVELLVSSGADVDAETLRGNRPLGYAVYHSRLDLVELLVAKGADVNGRIIGRPILLEAASRDHQLKEWYFRALEAFIGELPDPLFPQGNSDPQIVKLLLENGADVNARDAKGNTALTRARKRGDEKIVENTEVLRREVIAAGPPRAEPAKDL